VESCDYLLELIATVRTMHGAKYLNYLYSLTLWDYQASWLSQSHLLAHIEADSGTEERYMDAEDFFTRLSEESIIEVDFARYPFQFLPEGEELMPVETCQLVVTREHVRWKCNLKHASVPMHSVELSAEWLTDLRNRLKRDANV
jgi:hypothetical protein